MSDTIVRVAAGWCSLLFFALIAADTKRWIRERSGSMLARYQSTLAFGAFINVAVLQCARARRMNIVDVGAEWFLIACSFVLLVTYIARRRVPSGAELTLVGCGAFGAAALSARWQADVLTDFFALAAIACSTWAAIAFVRAPSGSSAPAR